MSGGSTVLSEENKAKFRLLATKAAAEAALSAISLGCDEILRACIEGLENAGPADENALQQDAETIGLLNLLAAKCEQTHTCSKRVAEVSETPGPASLLALLCCRRGANALLEVIEGNAPADGGREALRAYWRSRVDYWSKCISEELARTRRGQVLVMHVLAAVLPVYDVCSVPRHRAVLNLLLVPLLEDLFACPDRAHQAYTTYYFGQKAAANTAFNVLYNDIEVIEQFQARELFDRFKLLAVIRKTAFGQTAGEDATNQNTGEIAELPEELKREINKIIHGSPDKENNPPHPQTPNPKKTRVSQITCMIRKLEGSDQGAPNRPQNKLSGKHYSPVLDGVHYRRAEIESGKTPGDCPWPLHDPVKESDFKALVKARYRLGYDPADLDRLFKAPDDEETDYLPAWVQDGEVSLLWLLTAIAMSSNEWMNGQHADVGLKYTDIARVASNDADASVPDKYIYFGKNISDFLRSHLVLFDGDKPTAKAWALINFLERVVLLKRPQWYTKNLSDEIDCLFDCLVSARPSDLSDELFIDACKTLYLQMTKHGINSYESVVARARISTFALEQVLRDGDPTPYSLFLYPLSFSKVVDIEHVLPGAFLAGTYAGLEWSNYPIVTHLQNYHLFAMLDAIHPIVHFELGRVLSHDEASFAEKAATAARAEQRRATFEAVIPAVNKLTELFHAAQSSVYRIQSSVDVAWGGLFSASMKDVFAPLFVDKQVWAIKNRQGGEPVTVSFDHDSTGGDDKARKNLYGRLLYFARNVTDYTGPELGDSSWFSIEDVPAGLFDQEPFLKAMTIAALDESMVEKAASLNNLMKLLVLQVSDAKRGLHVCQLVAALCALQGDDKGMAQVLNGGEKDYNPKSSRGIINLSQLRENNQDKFLKLKDDKLAPSSFLRALSLLGTHFRKEDKSRSDMLQLEAIRVTQRSGKGVTVIVDCKNRFSDEVKQSLWTYCQSDDDEYHDLRTNFRTLCQGIGSFPKFDGNPDAIADEHNPFIILEAHKNGVWISSWRFVLDCLLR